MIKFIFLFAFFLVAYSCFTTIAFGHSINNFQSFWDSIVYNFGSAMGAFDLSIY